MSVQTLIVLLMVYICFTEACTKSRYSRYKHLDNRQVNDVFANVLFSTPLTVCARLCHNMSSCLSFLHNKNDGACQLFSQVLVDPEETESRLGNVMYRKIDDQGICSIPTTITKGRLLFIDGQGEGSRAEFVCDDYFFPTTETGVCSSTGTWTGLENACITMTSPYYIPAVEKIYPGVCVVVMATPTSNNKFRFRFQESDLYYIFIVIARLSEAKIVRNSKTNGNVWPKAEDNTPYWPFKMNQEFNLTVCAEENMYRVYVDNREMFTFVYRHPLSDIKQAVLSNDVVLRKIRFLG